MAWVRTVTPADDVSGLRRANVINALSIRPHIEEAVLNLVNAVSFENPGSGLTRLQREMIATVVSAVNHCRY